MCHNIDALLTAAAEPIARFDIPLTVNQCAALLQCHPQTVYSWIADGKLRAGYVGRHRRISQSELTRFMTVGTAVAPQTVA